MAGKDRVCFGWTVTFDTQGLNIDQSKPITRSLRPQTALVVRGYSKQERLCSSARTNKEDIVNPLNESF